MWLQRSFAPLKRAFPQALSSIIRSAVTASVTGPYTFYKKGHFRSSFARIAVDRHGNPLPWYTYPCIDFLRFRLFSEKHVMEFGAGQSTLWWASVAKSVLAFEGHQEWVVKLRQRMPKNAEVIEVDLSSARACVEDVRTRITKLPQQTYDVVVIDGLYRKELVPLAIEVMSPNGAIICDNSEGYEIWDAFVGLQFKRIDFYGNAPGVSLQHCTSIFFQNDCFLLEGGTRIADVNTQ